MYSVYMHISPTNKYYIGITSLKPKYRWGKNGSGYRGHTHFRFAIDSYGWDNFKHIVVAENLTKEAACQMEKELITQYKANDPNYGYNLSVGGEARALGTKRSLEQRKKMSERMMGNHNWTHKLSVRERKMVSERMMGNDYGAHRNITDEYKEKALVSQPNRREILQYTLNGEFVSKYRSLNEAFRNTGIWNIGEASRRYSKFGSFTAGGYIWIRKSDVTEELTVDDLVAEKIARKGN